MTETPTPLAYAPAPPLVRRRWFRLVVVVIIVGAFALAVYKFGGGFVRRARLVTLQRQCMSYVAPPTQIVYEGDPTAAKQLLAAGRGYTTTDGVSASFIPPAWSNFHAADGAGWQIHGTVLMHELTTPDGDRRLAFVDVTVSPVGGTPQQPIRMASFLSRIYVPGSVYAPPRIGLSIGTGDAIGMTLDPSADTLRVYAGQVNPSDASRFTFVYELNGVKRTVEGHLRDVDSVVLEHIDSPERLKREMKQALKE